MSHSERIETVPDSTWNEPVRVDDVSSITSIYSLHRHYWPQSYISFNLKVILSITLVAWNNVGSVICNYVCIYPILVTAERRTHAILVTNISTNSGMFRLTCETKFRSVSHYQR